MRDRISTWMPQDVETPIHVFRGVTIRDMFRIGTPAFLGFFVAGLAGAAVGGLVGGVVYAVRPKGDPVDVHAVNAVHHAAGLHMATPPSVERFVRDVAVLDNGDVVGVVEVSGVDLDMQPEWEQEALRDTVTDLYSGVEFPVELYSVQAHRSLEQYQTDEDVSVGTRHFAVVRSGSGGVGNSETEAVETVRNRCGEVRNALSGADFAAKRVTGRRFRDVVQYLQLEDLELSATSFTAMQGSSEEEFRGVYVSGFPEHVETGWLADVLNVDGRVWAVQSVEPADRDIIDNVVERVRAELSVTRDPRREAELKRNVDDAERVRKRELKGDKPVRYGVFIAAVGSERSDTGETLRQVKEVLRRHRIEHREPWLRMRNAVKTVSLPWRNQIPHRQVATSQSAAGAFPFDADDPVEDGGVVFGRDVRSESPVILDRFSWDAGHIARMGKSGAGKSYVTKLEVLRSLERYDNLQVVLIDPKQEYADVASVSGRVRRFTVDDRTKDNSDLLVDYVRRAYRLGHRHQGKTLVVLDEASRVLNDEQGRQVLGELVREGRDQDIAATLVTQNSDDFTHLQEGRNMLRQVDCYEFMCHQNVDSSVEDFFNLSNREKVQLRKLRTGSKVDFSEAVIRGPVNTVLRIESLEQEKTVLNSEEDHPEQRRGEVRSSDRGKPVPPPPGKGSQIGKSLPSIDLGEFPGLPEFSDLGEIERMGLSFIPVLAVLGLTFWFQSMGEKMLMNLTGFIGVYAALAWLFYWKDGAGG